MKIAEYKQIDTQTVINTVMVDDFDERGEIIGQHEETVTRQIPVMGMVYRDKTPEEEAEALSMQAEAEECEANREPTFEEQMEARLLYLELMTGLLDEEV